MKNTNETTINIAAGIALKDKELEASLREWFGKKGVCPFPEKTDFAEWLGAMLDMMAGNIPNRSPSNIVIALRVNTVGVRYISEIAKSAEDNGFKTDVNNYCEGEFVYSSVWIDGKTKDENFKKAEEIEEKMKEFGYDAEWLPDDEDDSVTVYGRMSFTDYMKKQA